MKVGKIDSVDRKKRERKKKKEREREREREKEKERKQERKKERKRERKLRSAFSDPQLEIVKCATHSFE